MSWEKYDEARKAAGHASMKAELATKNAHQLNTKSAHSDASKAHQHAAELHTEAHYQKRELGKSDTEHKAEADKHFASASSHNQKAVTWRFPKSERVVHDVRGSEYTVKGDRKYQ